MQATTSVGAYIGFAVLVIGFLLLIFRRSIAGWVAAFYKKVGVDVPEEKYARQCSIIGFILMILGFLAATGLIAKI